jgi:hypothetical protein
MARDSGHGRALPLAIGAVVVAVVVAVLAELLGAVPAAGAAGSAAAQPVLLPPEPIPLAAGIATAPIGAWSLYRIRDPDSEAEQLRVTLVARDGKFATLEFRSALPTDGPPSTRHFTLQVRVALDLRTAAPGPALVQVDGKAPMKLAGPDLRRTLARPLAGALVGDEVVKVPAGERHTRHYRIARPDEVAVDVWLADDLYPLALVKLQQEPGLLALPVETGKRGMSFFAWPVGSSWELMATGLRGKSTIQGAPRPFDGAALEREFKTAGGGPPGPRSGTR